MLLVNDIIRKQLKKRKMSQQDLVDRINRLGISEGKVSIQNVNNMLNNPNEIRPVLVKKIEIAL